MVHIEGKALGASGSMREKAGERVWWFWILRLTS